MFCTKCGNRIDINSRYCVKCGEKTQGDILHKNTHTLSPKSKSIIGLESKPWYRFLKVVYILFFILIVVTALGIVIATKPEREFNGELSTIACDNGKNYAPEENNIWVYSDSISDSNDKNARILCKYDTLNFYNYQYSNESILKNYTFKPVYNEAKYLPWIGYSLFGLGGAWLFLRLIKIAFFYITIGKRMTLNDFKKIF